MFFYFNYFPGFPAVLGIDRTGTCSPEVAINISLFHNSRWNFFTLCYSFADRKSYVVSLTFNLLAGAECSRCYSSFSFWRIHSSTFGRTRRRSRDIVKVTSAVKIIFLLQTERRWKHGKYCVAVWQTRIATRKSCSSCWLSF